MVLTNISKITGVKLFISGVTVSQGVCFNLLHKCRIKSCPADVTALRTSKQWAYFGAVQNGSVIRKFLFCYHCCIHIQVARIASYLGSHEKRNQMKGSCVQLLRCKSYVTADQSYIVVMHFLAIHRWFRAHVLLSSKYVFFICI